MSTRVQKPIPKVSKRDADELAEKDADEQAAAQKAADLTETDELLDEIDALLEEVGVETAINFRQKGGQ